jgi:hypothetical protein
MVEMAADRAVAAEVPTPSTEGAARRADGLEASRPAAQAAQATQVVQATQAAQVVQAAQAASGGALRSRLEVARGHEAVRAEQRAAG